MSQFLEKITSGLATTPEDWNAHLLEAHRVTPGMTPLAFSAYRSPAGKSSYQLLAESLDRFQGRGLTVLDLACGDGHLINVCRQQRKEDINFIGVDMSETELDRGRRLVDGPVQFRCERVQGLSDADSAVDAILCHMAFMLMLPLDPVIEQIHRVLKPGGVFAAVVGTKPEPGSLLQLINKEVGTFFRSEFPKIGPGAMGDSRVNSVEGLKGIFNHASGFHDEIEVEDFQLEVQSTPLALWNDIFSNMYVIDLLDVDSKTKLKRKILAFFESNLRGANVELEFPMRKFVTTKRWLLPTPAAPSAQPPLPEGGEYKRV